MSPMLHTNEPGIGGADIHSPDRFLTLMNFHSINMVGNLPQGILVASLSFQIDSCRAIKDYRKDKIVKANLSQQVWVE